MILPNRRNTTCSTLSEVRLWKPMILSSKSPARTAKKGSCKIYMAREHHGSFEGEEGAGFVPLDHSQRRGGLGVRDEARRLGNEFFDSV